MSEAGRDGELAPGATFGGYEVVRRLGAGAFGAVYEALKLPLKKRVALKVLHRELLWNEEVMARFLREAEIVAQLEHPHIVSVFDVAAHDGQPYLAMEFLEGETLAARLEREGRLSVEDTLDVLLPVMSAIEAVHDRGIVHRDLKPDNIFLARLPTGATQPRLLDFGIAKVQASNLAISQSHAMMGTPYYMSPEQTRQAKYVEASSDQWALGVIAYECVSGRRPFQSATLLELMLDITTREAPALRELEPSLPEGVDAVIHRALSREADARWPSVHAFGRALLPWASERTRAVWGEFFGGVNAPAVSARPSVPAASDGAIQFAATLEPAARPTSPASEERRRSWMIPVVAVLTALVAGGAWKLAPQRAPAATPAATSIPERRVEPTTEARPEAPHTDARPRTPEPAVALPAQDAAAPEPQVAQVTATVERVEPRRRARHRRRARQCPNGICPPD